MQTVGSKPLELSPVSLNGTLSPSDPQRRSAFSFGGELANPEPLVTREVAPYPALPDLDARSERPLHPARGIAQTRAFDVVCSLLAILLFLPVLLAAALAIRLTSPGPVLFVQKRVGRHGELFPCLKFRSMVVDSQQRLEALLAGSEEARLEWAKDQKLRNDPRITPIGNVLRKTSLDELPQLLNVLLGHMSIVGPRPIVQNEVVRYGKRFSAYCSVRPGLTGLWQVSGRNEVSYDTRVRLDAFYSTRKSLSYDIAICLRTIPAVFASRGCY